MGYVMRVGVELEGGWDQAPPDMQGDGSVDTNRPVNGEVVTPTPGYSPVKIGQWILDNYPQEVNGTCGMHVHVSFYKLRHYALVMENGFYQYLLQELDKWGHKMGIIARHPFWPRLAGTWSPNGANYCQKGFVPEQQVFYQSKGRARYYHLNYTWSRYGTVECRILPMFKVPQIAVSAVECVIKSYESYLVKACKQRERPTEIVVQGETDIEGADDATFLPLKPQSDNDYDYVRPQTDNDRDEVTTGNVRPSVREVDFSSPEYVKRILKNFSYDYDEHIMEWTRTEPIDFSEHHSMYLANYLPLSHDEVRRNAGIAKNRRIKITPRRP